jgi:hypothetical protein
VPWTLHLCCGFSCRLPPAACRLPPAATSTAPRRGEAPLGCKVLAPCDALLQLHTRSNGSPPVGLEANGGGGGSGGSASTAAPTAAASAAATATSTAAPLPPFYSANLQLPQVRVEASPAQLMSMCRSDQVQSGQVRSGQVRSASSCAASSCLGV